MTGTEPMNTSGAIASRQRERAPADPPAGPLRQAIAPVTSPGEQAAERPQREQAAGVRLGAVLVGERDGGHLGGAEQRAEGGRDDARAAPRGATASAGRAPAARRCAVGRGLGGALGGERQGAGDRRRRCATLSPASGCQVVASTVTMIGPTMNTASSATASSA